MSAFKRVKKSDVVTIPYIANKQYTIHDYEFPNYNVGFFSGVKGSGSFDPINNTVSNGEYARLIYDSINHLYYHNYSGSYLETASRVITMFFDSASSYRPTGSYMDYTIDPITLRNLPSASGDQIKVISIPRNIASSGILRTSFYLESLNNNVYAIDDGHGNLIDTGSGTYYGNVFYEHGIVVITNPTIVALVDTNTKTTISFKNMHLINEKTIKCTIKDHEYNYSYNTSLIISGSDTTVQDFVTASNFMPYVTQIGLYNDSNELLAVAKFSQPVPISPITEQTFLIKINF